MTPRPGATPPVTLADVLLRRAGDTATAFRITGSQGEVLDDVSGADLVLAATARAAVLRDRGLRGERILLLAPSGREYVEWLAACLLGGAIAVPSVPATARHHHRRVLGIAQDCDAAAVIAPRGHWDRLPQRLRDRLIDVDELATDPGDPAPQPATAHDIAFLQYTSGSTGDPRGVVLTHGCVLENTRRIAQTFRLGPDARASVWLPLYHDMGLIGGLLTPLMVGFGVDLMSPQQFARRPMSWLETISRARATVSGGPTSAYDVCARALEELDPDRDRIDLSSWEVAFVGAEPVRPSTMDRFARAAARFGFRAESLRPCYGLAESTLMVSCADRLRTVTPSRNGEGAPARQLVSCGPPVAGLEVAIADPATGAVAPRGTIGEILVRGDSVAAGYWGRPDDPVFNARIAGDERTYLRTGDLGYLDDDGAVVPTGRTKDMLVVHGRNIYPQDLEEIAARGCAPHGCALAGAFADADGSGVVLLVETDAPDLELPEVLRTCRRLVRTELEIDPTTIAVVRSGTLPRTPSGKIRRGPARETWSAGRISTRRRSERAVDTRLWRRRAVETRQRLERASEPERHGIVRDFLAERLTALAGRDDDAPRSISSLGIDSLSLFTLAEDLDVIAGTRLPRPELFAADTLESLAVLLSDRWRPSRETPDGGVSDPGRSLPRPPDAWRDASARATALWLLEARYPGASNEWVAFEVRGRWPLDDVEEAVAAVVDGHDALRCAYRLGPSGVQLRVVPRDRSTPVVSTVDARSWSEDVLRARLAEEAGRPVDLTTGRPFRVSRFVRSADEQVLLLLAPHMAIDFTSMDIIADEIVRGDPPVPAGSYLDYADTVDSYLASSDARGAEEFFRRMSHGVPRTLPLRDTRGPVTPSARAAELTIELGGKLTGALRSLARQERATVFQVLLALLHATLHAETGQRSQLVGVAMSTRTPPFAATVGLLMNVVPLACVVEPGMSFRALLRSTRERLLAAGAHRHHPDPMVACADGAALPDVLLSFQRHTGDEPSSTPSPAGPADGLEAREGQLRWRPVHVPRRLDTLPLTMVVADRPGGFTVTVRHLTDVVPHEMAARLAASYRSLAERVAGDGDPVVDRTALRPVTRSPGSPVEAVAMADRPAAQPRNTASGATVPAALRAVAGRFGDRIALDDEHRSHTYRELLAQVESAASGLVRAGVRPGDAVCLLHERDATAVVVTLAALFAGATYVHLDPGSPPGRLAAVVRQTAARLVIASGSLAPVARGLGVPVVLSSELSDGSTGDTTMPAVHGGDAAYISFTSGSAGMPRGVVVEHAMVVAAALAFAGKVGLAPHDVVACVSPLGWDIVVGDLHGTLLSGGRLTMVPERYDVDGPGLRRLLDGRQVTTLVTTPQRWRLIVDAGWRGGPGFKVVSGGDVLLPADVERLRAGGRRLWNFYGPTETVLWATSADLTSCPVGTAVPIGTALPGYQVHLVGPDLRQVEPGEPGEIVICGPTVARGYLTDPRRTAEKFVPDPFARTPGARLYRSGDLGRLAEGAGVVYAGRIDDQVKIRGRRVELTEIEAAVSGHPDVATAAALVLPGTDEVATYVVPADGRVPSLTVLREYLAEFLPAFMLPTRFAVVPRLPLNTNGKVDRGALCRLPAQRVAHTGTRPVRTPHEQAVRAAFTAVLGVGDIAADDDFFALGGHSLGAVNVAAHLSERLGAPVPVQLIFERPVLADLAAALGDGRPDPGPAPPVPPEPEPAGDGVPVLSGQRRLWLQQQRFGHDAGLTIPCLVEFSGRVEPEHMVRAFDAVVERHVSLRTLIRLVDGEPRQFAGGRPQLSVVRGGDDDAGRDAERRARRRLDEMAGLDWDLENGPLVRAELHLEPASRAVLAIALHHAISDGWSAGVLLRDFMACYCGYLHATAPDLAPLPLDEHQAALARHRTPAGTDGALRELVRLLIDAPPSNLPVTGGGAAVTGAGRCVRDLGDLPGRLARARASTVFALVVTAFLASLRVRTGSADQVFGLDLAGRDDPRLQPLVGYFGNQGIARVSLAGSASFEDLLRRVSRALLDAQRTGLVPYQDVVAELRRHGRRVDAGRLFDVKMVHQLLPGLGAGAGEVGVRLLDTGTASGTDPLALWLWQSADSTRVELHHQLSACSPAWVSELLDETVAVMTALEERWRGTVRKERGSPWTDADAFPSFDEVLLPEPPPASGTAAGVSRSPSGTVQVGGTAATHVPELAADVAAAELGPWMAEHRAGWEAALGSHGAVLLRGVRELDADGVCTASDTVFTADYISHEHPRQVVADRVVSPVAYPPDQELLWHNEDSFNLRWPGRMIFACRTPAGSGGETTLVDGTGTWQRMSPELRRAFAERGVRYTRRFVRGFGLDWETVYGTTDPDEVTRRCRAEGVTPQWQGDMLVTHTVRPAVLTRAGGETAWFAQILHWHRAALPATVRADLEGLLDGVLPRDCSFGDGTPIPDAFVDFLITDSRRHEYVTRWQSGDLLIVDNTRHAHGRRAFRGPRDVMVALGDPASFDDVLPD
ncbi:amino acid adenylation domain-containing protein [Dactylosporangium roseum]|uniref:Amino acid adenylation domain-containing protein n=1 Tax=Dactylosporangium roseum TaxID=47989 RepID=A0ABY5ZBC6_9ACTN|nr:non-ribosomal peptide synthetase [Dactylosporangium roseum]UWZ39411.1 amino acid adenylation domain-containing protein [Dactylosporangium roseum]